MEEDLERLMDVVWYLTLRFGRDHPDSFIPEGTLIEDNVIYNCSYCILVHDIGEKVNGIGDVRLIIELDDESLYMQIFKGRRWSSPDRLVFDHKKIDGMSSELKIERGDWEQRILREHTLKCFNKPQEIV